MPRVERKATIVWEGNVARGHGTIDGQSGALRSLEYSLPTRIGDAAGKTSPEELIAAAHGACFAMALSSELSKLGHPPEQLQVTCVVTLDEVEPGKHRIVRSALTARGRVPGVADDEFQRAAKDAEEGCPVTAVLDTEITLEAQLER